jgi:hypothetical protein
MDADDETDEIDEHAWPEALVAAGAVRSWIASALPGRPQVVGPILIHMAKAWGVTASFALMGVGPAREVVFKACLLPRFATSAVRIYPLLDRLCPGAVPHVLATQAQPDGASWLLFDAFDGRPVAETDEIDALLALARTLAQIQVAVADAPETEKAGMPCAPIGMATVWFDATLVDVRGRYAAFWQGIGRELAAQFHLPPDVAGRMATYRPHLAAWARELDRGGWPLTIDHVDLHGENAVVRPDGGILIFDWEEANLSCPFFSLDRLLDDAHEMAEERTTEIGRYTPAERALRGAYLATLPWGAAEARVRALDLALCLAPLKTAYEAGALAAALGWPEGAPHIAAWALGRALPRWERMAAEVS